MGNFERFVFSNGRWTHDEIDVPWGPDGQVRPWLAIEIYDSDFASVDYRPAGIASGHFYLRIQPKDHFDDPAANEWVNVKAEASGLASWAYAVLGKTISSADILPFVAPEGVDEPDDVFVEETMERLLGCLGLPMPN